jgi:hypothetical protein
MYGTLEYEYVYFWNTYGLNYVFAECKYADLWSFNISGSATGIEPRPDEDTRGRNR